MQRTSEQGADISPLTLTKGRRRNEKGNCAFFLLAGLANDEQQYCQEDRRSHCVRYEKEKRQEGAEELSVFFQLHFVHGEF